MAEALAEGRLPQPAEMEPLYEAWCDCDTYSSQCDAYGSQRAAFYAGFFAAAARLPVTPVGGQEED